MECLEPNESKFEEQYIPVNYISNEVLAIIDRWESSKLERSPEQKMSMLDFDSVQVSGTADHWPQPKLFYRTFWRRIARRILFKIDKM